MNAQKFHTIPSTFPAALQTMLSALERGVGEFEKTNYPPYNVVKIDEDTFCIELAVAGFSLDEIDVSVEKNVLKVSGTKAPKDDVEDREFLHRGIAERDFMRSFPLSEYIVVEGASMKNGILSVELARIIPDEAKARKVEIRNS